MTLLNIHLIRPLLVTLVTELLAAAILGVRSRKGFRTVTLVNCITNPAANVLVLLMQLNMPYIWSLRMIPLLEGGIVVAEACLFRSFMKEIRHPFLFSLALNAISFFPGGWILKRF